MGIKSEFIPQTPDLQQQKRENQEVSKTSNSSISVENIQGVSKSEHLSSHINTSQEKKLLDTLFGKAKKCAEVFMFISTLSGVPGILDGSIDENSIAETLQKSRDQQQEQLVQQMHDIKNTSSFDEAPHTVSDTKYEV